MFSQKIEKDKAVLVNSEDCKNLMKNYRQISLLPMLCKVFERLTFNPMFSYFMEKKLFTECQFGFVHRDLYVTPLLMRLKKFCQQPTV